MKDVPKTLAELLAENQTLWSRLEEAESTLAAIRGGQVDAFLVAEGTADERVLVLDGVDRPYRLLIERMQQGAATLTSDGTVIYANHQLAELLASAVPDLVGKALGPHVAAADGATFADLLARGQSGDAECEIELKRGDGAVIPVLLTASPLLEQLGILCLVVTDLTQKKRHERERERYVEEKAARAAAERTNDVLREADRRKDEFLAMLAHELRNPLAPLSHGLEVLNRVNAQESAARKAREMMSRQVQSLIRLVDDLLDVSRVSQGKIQLHRELIPLRQVVSRAVETCRPFIDERGHRLDVTLPEDPLWIEADPMRVQQVVVNLLNNAAKFTSPGGNLALTVELAADPPQAVVRIRDSGIGISADMLARIFDLFIQADPTVSRAEGGLGIGLTLSRRLVEMHGGSLHASSSGLGQGSEFVIRFPLAERGEADRGAASAAAAGPAVRSKGLRILIVDDNRDAGESLSALLRLLGHEVRQATDGQKAVALAAEFLPDIVLLDLGMPGMSGFEVAAELQLLSALVHTRLVALTGYGSAEDRDRTRAAGFHHHLVKPLELTALEPILAGLAGG